MPFLPKKMTPRILAAAAGVIVLAAVLVFLLARTGEPVSGADPDWVGDRPAEQVSYSEVVDLLSEPGRSGATGRVLVAGDRAYVEIGREKRAVIVTALVPDAAAFADRFAAGDGIELAMRAPASRTSLSEILLATTRLVVLGLIVAGAIFYARSFGLVGRKASAFEVVPPGRPGPGLAAVAGLDIARGDIEEIVAFLTNPGGVSRAGGRMPRGALFEGPPGTGKTLLARALAQEAGVAFIKVDASQMSQMYVGAGAMKVRNLFRIARRMAPCIVFVDEIDAMGKARGSGVSAGHDEKENTLNALLVELDGFEAREGIFLVAATNRPETLDPALTRPGRIDRRVTMALPDLGGREAILSTHAASLDLAPDVDLRRIAATCCGFSGARLEMLVNEAAIAAGRDGRSRTSMADFEIGRDRAILPGSGASLCLDPEERRIVAVHEAGHALAAALSPDADPIEKVTIAPQGQAGGFVMQSPDKDRRFQSLARLRARLDVAVAGREAERRIFGADHITTGAASDIEQATDLARVMVTAYGMSDLGFVRIDPDDRSMPDMSSAVFREVGHIISGAQERMARLMAENELLLRMLANRLDQVETVSGGEVAMFVAAARHRAA